MAAISSSSPSVPVALQDVRETPIHRSFLSHPLFEANVLTHVLQFCGPASADVVLEKTTSVAQTVAQIANVSIARDPQISPEERGSQLRSKMDPLVRTYRQLNQPFQRVAHWRKELADFPDREARKERIKNMFKEAVQTRNYPLFRFWFENENLTDIRAYADASEYVNLLTHSDGDGKFNLEELNFVHTSMILDKNKIELFAELADLASARKDFVSLRFVLNNLNFTIM